MARRRRGGDSSFGSVYKHPELPRKQQLCAICCLRTRGRAVAVHLTFGVTVQLCEGEHAPALRSPARGRELVELLAAPTGPRPP